MQSHLQRGRASPRWTPHRTPKYASDTSTIGRQSDITPASAESAIPSHFAKSDWIPVIALFSPGLLLAALLGIPATRESTFRFMADNWGSVASVWGLGVSFYVYFVAKGAKKAAEEARSAERLRTALAKLEDAAAKCIEIGQYARNGSWDVVELRAQEVLACCRTTLAAWGNNPALKESRNKLNDVATFMHSMVEESRKDAVNREYILNAQLDSYEKLSVVVGKIQKEDKSGDK